MNFLSFLAALPSIIQGLLALQKKLEVMFGPDYIKKLNDLSNANKKLAEAKTNEEADEALIAIANIFYRKP